jgi:hypothetical protein
LISPIVFTCSLFGLHNSFIEINPCIMIIVIFVWLNNENVSFYRLKSTVLLNFNDKSLFTIANWKDKILLNYQLYYTWGAQQLLLQLFNFRVMPLSLCGWKENKTFNVVLWKFARYEYFVRIRDLWFFTINSTTRRKNLQNTVPEMKKKKNSQIN